MELREIGIALKDKDQALTLYRTLAKNGVPLDPKSGDMRIEIDKDGMGRLIIFAIPKIEALLTEQGYQFVIIRDYKDEPDPRRYVSKSNRFADELAKLRKQQGR